MIQCQSGDNQQSVFFMLEMDWFSIKLLSLICGSQEHLNFYCTASNHGNLVLSLRHEEVKEQEYLHIILR